MVKAIIDIIIQKQYNPIEFIQWGYTVKKGEIMNLYNDYGDFLLKTLNVLHCFNIYYPLYSAIIKHFHI